MRYHLFYSFMFLLLVNPTPCLSSEVDPCENLLNPSMNEAKFSQLIQTQIIDPAIKDAEFQQKIIESSLVKIWNDKLEASMAKWQEQNPDHDPLLVADAVYEIKMYEAMRQRALATAHSKFIQTFVESIKNNISKVQSQFSPAIQTLFHHAIRPFLDYMSQWFQSSNEDAVEVLAREQALHQFEDLLTETYDFLLPPNTKDFAETVVTLIEGGADGSVFADYFNDMLAYYQAYTALLQDRHTSLMNQIAQLAPRTAREFKIIHDAAKKHFQPDITQKPIEESPKLPIAPQTDSIGPFPSELKNLLSQVIDTAVKKINSYLENDVAPKKLDPLHNALLQAQAAYGHNNPQTLDIATAFSEVLGNEVEHALEMFADEVGHGIKMAIDGLPNISPAMHQLLYECAIEALEKINSIVFDNFLRSALADAEKKAYEKMVAAPIRTPQLASEFYAARAINRKALFELDANTLGEKLPDIIAEAFDQHLKKK